MGLLDHLAEAKIAAAIAAGEFDRLPGAGKPLDLDHEPLVPEDVRVAWRILRNAGFLPPELEERRERVALERLLRAIDGDDEARGRAAARLALLEARAEAAGRGLGVPAAYRGRLIERLG